MREKPPITSFGVIVLAAGSSRRMGTPKQLLPFRGRSLLRHCVETALAADAAATAVVLGAEASRMRAEIGDYPVDMLVNEDYGTGMAGSIVRGVKAMREGHPEIDGVLIMVCDQPFVSAAHLGRLVMEQRETGAAIVSSHYGDTRGVPALFHQSLFGELLALQGDRGARSLIERYGDLSRCLPFPEGAIDIDTPDAYAALASLRENETLPSPAPGD